MDPITADGLHAGADPTFDRYARIVRDALGVSMGLVTVMREHCQIIPGAAGLPQPWERLRETPLTHSVCQVVVGDAAPMIITDTRLDTRLFGNLAAEALGVVAYAGVPLRGPDNAVLGAVCAIDSTPRTWTEAQVRLIGDVAELCSAELMLRGPGEAVGSTTIGRAELLLSLSEALADTRTVTDIVEALSGVVAATLGCSRVGIWLSSAQDRSVLRYVDHPGSAWNEAQQADIPADTSTAIGAALLEGRPYFFADRGEQDTVFPRLRAPVRMADSTARAAVPLMVSGSRLGTLVLFWPLTRHFGDDDRATITALARYTSQAVARATLLAERVEVASTLQAALLPSSLPSSDSVEVLARYRAASAQDLVGGDWYDCLAMADGSMRLMIGDVRGHDVQSAATMGSLRTMLRALAWADQDTACVTIVRLAEATRQFGMDVPSTLVFGRLGAPAPDGTRLLEWTNAGHPPPIVVDAEGRCTVLADGLPCDTMLGVASDRPRHDQHLVLAAGSTLLLYTDGLLETDDHDVDLGLARLTSSLQRNHGLPLGDLLDRVLAELVGRQPDDDVALLALRCAAAPGAS